ncbi:hypothetical protein CRYUN_Cryun27aG0079200 [Craigia yunnanensis]
MFFLRHPAAPASSASVHPSRPGILSAPRRPWCATAESVGHEYEVSSAEKSSAVLSLRDPRKYHRWDDPDYKKWKDKEEEILRDIEPIISITKEILHSDNLADEEALVEKRLCHHPHSEGKIGSRLDSIMANLEAAYLENIYYKL